jgi:hypothetical protein
MIERIHATGIRLEQKLGAQLTDALADRSRQHRLASDAMES